MTFTWNGRVRIARILRRLSSLWSECCTCVCIYKFTCVFMCVYVNMCTRILRCLSSLWSECYTTSIIWLLCILMCVCGPVYLCVWMYLYTYICVDVCKCIYVYTNTSSFVELVEWVLYLHGCYTYTCVYLCLYIYLCVYSYICKCVYVHICVYVCEFFYVCIGNWCLIMVQRHPSLLSLRCEYVYM